MVLRKRFTNQITSHWVTNVHRRVQTPQGFFSTVFGHKTSPTVPEILVHVSIVV